MIAVYLGQLANTLQGEVGRIDAVGMRLRVARVYARLVYDGILVQKRANRQHYLFDGEERRPLAGTPGVQQRDAHLAVLVQVGVHASRENTPREELDFGYIEWVVLGNLHLKHKDSVVVHRVGRAEEEELESGHVAIVNMHNELCGLLQVFDFFQKTWTIHVSSTIYDSFLYVLKFI